jgi:hypothetical protein
MYVPATPVQPALPLAPVGVVSTAPTSIVPPSNTTIKVRDERLNVLENHRASVTGSLLEDGRPSHAGQTVTLQALGAHGWRTISDAHTNSHGRFRLSYLPRRLGTRLLRLRFKGDALARSARRRIGRLNVYHLDRATSTVSRSFVDCVTNMESSMNWHIVDPPYSGGDQWTVSTWLAAGGGRYAPSADRATPSQQIRVFERYEPSHPSAWPVTVPACS